MLKADSCPLTEIVEINPVFRPTGLSLDSLVSFIPMSDVTSSGEWVNKQVRRLRHIDGGFTPFRENDVLFAKITPCMENGKGCHARGLSQGIGFGSTEFHVLRARQTTDARFIFHWCQSKLLRQAAEAYMIGSAGQQRVQSDFFEHFRVRKFQITEQRQISKILDTVDRAIQQTATVISKLKAIKEGLLHDLLITKLRASPELALGDVASINPESLPQSTSRQFEFCYIDLSSVENGRIYWDRTRSHKFASAPSRARRILRAGDVLVCTVRPGLLGHGYFHRSDQMPSICSTGFAVLRAKKGACGKFLFYCLFSEQLISQMRRAEVGSNYPAVNESDVATMKIRVPSLDQQIEIVKILEACDHRILGEESFHAKLGSLKSGLSHDLLGGGVRVRVEEQIPA